MTPVVRQLLVANVLVYALQQLAGDALFTHFALWPLGHHIVAGVGVVGFEPWQLLSSAFLHDPDSPMHIVFNMFALWSFGIMVERAVGSVRFAVLYFASVLTGSIVQLLVVTAALDHGVGPTVGASGGVFGVLLAFAFLYPHARTLVFPIPFPVKAWVLVTGFAVIELASGVLGTTQGVAHFAHLGGMIGAGAVLFYWWRSSRPPSQV
jgi:membrane associated rhomboid family serine protease